MAMALEHAGTASTPQLLQRSSGHVVACPEWQSGPVPLRRTYSFRPTSQRRWQGRRDVPLVCAAFGAACASPSLRCRRWRRQHSTRVSPRKAAFGNRFEHSDEDSDDEDNEEDHVVLINPYFDEDEADDDWDDEFFKEPPDYGDSDAQLEDDLERENSTYIPVHSSVGDDAYSEPHSAHPDDDDDYRDSDEQIEDGWEKEWELGIPSGSSYQHGKYKKPHQQSARREIKAPRGSVRGDLAKHSGDDLEPHGED